jgi:hypothetical protein
MQCLHLGQLVGREHLGIGKEELKLGCRFHFHQPIFLQFMEKLKSCEEAKLLKMFTPMLLFIRDVLWGQMWIWLNHISSGGWRRRVSHCLPGERESPYFSRNVQGVALRDF